MTAEYICRKCHSKLSRPNKLNGNLSWSKSNCWPAFVHQRSLFTLLQTTKISHENYACRMLMRKETHPTAFFSSKVLQFCLAAIATSRTRTRPTIANILMRTSFSSLIVVHVRPKIFHVLCNKGLLHYTIRYRSSENTDSACKHGTSFGTANCKYVLHESTTYALDIQRNRRYFQKKKKKCHRSVDGWT